MNNPNESKNQSVQFQLSQLELTRTLPQKPQNQLQQLTLGELESISGGLVPFPRLH